MDRIRQEGSWPAALADEAARADWMTRPSEALVRFVADLEGPLVVLGAGGKMGPSLCALVRRAIKAAGSGPEVVAVSRFTDAATRQRLEAAGVRTLVADLLDPDAVARLPEARNVLYLVGLKFGTSAAPSRTWAVNTLAPAAVCQRYAGSRIVALSTGNVYPLKEVEGPASREGDALMPLGEYANACVARERLFEYGAERYEIDGVLVRLNYALDLRYGVLVDLATRIHAGQPVDVTMGFVNLIWQRDANDMIVRALGLAAPGMRPLNLTGLERLSVRELAEDLGRELGRKVTIVGEEAPTALLSDAYAAADALGAPHTPLDVVLRWTARWVAAGNPVLGKPTLFAVRDGRF